MQRSPISATIDHQSGLVDPSAIYRRLDGRPKRRPLWMTAVAMAVLAVVAAGGAIAFQDELTPMAQHAQVLAPVSASR